MQPSAREPIRRLFRSFAARISFFVFAATLLSALAVAWTSAHALRAFLRAKVEQKIPAAVAQVHDRLDLWYAQRTLDVQVFARSAIVVDALARVARAGAGRGEARDRAEVEQYLTYVLEGLPQYVSLFVLDAEARTVLGVGRAVALEPTALQRLAAVEDADVSGVLIDRELGPVQAVSSVVRGRDERRLFTLHAVLPLRVLAEQLAGGTPSGSGRTLVFDQQGGFVAASRLVGSSTPSMSAELAGAQGDVHHYLAPDGVRVVGSAMPFARLHWTLVVEEESDAAFAPIAAILGHIVALNLGIVLALSALAFAVVASLVRPLHALSDCARRLRDGEENVELPVVTSSDEVGILARSFVEMVYSLKRANETLEQLAITDGLTKIHNHRYFQDQLTKEIKRCERAGAPLALVLVDIDDFKALNDRHGHAVGDVVLERLAALLVEQTRDHDLVARYGGEEFAILAPETDLAGALALAEKVHTAVGEMVLDVPPARGALAITVSIGVAVYRGDRKAFFHAADRALYSAKGSGKDCVMAAAS
jgi:diguanylate cyclase (GGDEF)-like protein